MKVGEEEARRELESRDPIDCWIQLRSTSKLLRVEIGLVERRRQRKVEVILEGDESECVRPDPKG